MGALAVPRGDYQINCFEIEPKDIGSLTLALEQLKEKLRLNTKNAFDAIVVARGGGSMEDLYYKRKHSKKLLAKIIVKLF